MEEHKWKANRDIGKILLYRSRGEKASGGARSADVLLLHTTKCICRNFELNINVVYKLLTDMNLAVAMTEEE